ncbi:hypothetical protein K469DRAFT_682364 [Zopfia rhizophila CBS 207.26]|uniref:Uncharacterized protein n=1 Tax=Zopfia rhizophila CBS 207.26 TaxID=1314779 RepID=A0A6A6EHC2_9PEZI|nr:hypothetical protein K469DRAFT_682364 [Zopfia rhizophila CBS 207.26]
MPTKSRSPRPESTPQLSSSQIPRLVDKQTTQQVPRRAGSAGGIVLTEEQTEKERTGVMSSTPALASTSTHPPKETSTSTGPNRQRRRPRKLNKEPASTPNLPPTNTATVASTNDTQTPASTTELEALKSRVRGLEAKVEELYESGVVRGMGARSPRRRGKGRKGSARQVPTTTTSAEGKKVEKVDEEVDEELTRLEGELEIARRDLESYHPGSRTRPRTKRTDSEETEFIQAIEREGGQGVEDMVDMRDRQVTLTGSYRIPLPASVSMADVRSIQSGVSAAQNVAKGFLEQRRAQQAVQDQTKSLSAAAWRSEGMQAMTTSAGSSDGGEKQSWGEWFGGYSVAISRAVKNIEAEAAIESQKVGAPRRPIQAEAAAETEDGKFE